MRCERIDVLLALHDVDPPRLGELVQPVRHNTDAVEVPEPAAPAVGAATAKVLRLVAHDLIEQLSALVGVVIRRHDAWRSRAGATLVEELRHRDAGTARDSVKCAASVASDDEAPVAVAEAERSVLIVVGRAPTVPPRTVRTAAGALDARCELGGGHVRAPRAAR